MKHLRKYLRRFKRGHRFTIKDVEPHVPVKYRYAVGQMLRSMLKQYELLQLELDVTGARPIRVYAVWDIKK